MSTGPSFVWTPTSQDYEAALRLWRDGSGSAARTRMLGSTLIAIGFVVTFVAVAYVHAGWLALVPFLGIVGIGAMWWADLPARIGLRQVVSSTPEMLQPLSVVVDQRGLTATNPSGTEQFPWSVFVAYIESDTMMVLGMSLDSPAAVGILKEDAAVGDLTWETATDRVRANVDVHPRIAHLRERRRAR
ncbi:MAG: hypothetical protein U0R68_15820 [Candidatus Nanopelagicales bacterium]